MNNARCGTCASIGSQRDDAAADDGHNANKAKIMDTRARRPSSADAGTGAYVAAADGGDLCYVLVHIDDGVSVASQLVAHQTGADGEHGAKRCAALAQAQESERRLWE